MCNFLHGRDMKSNINKLNRVNKKVTSTLVILTAAPQCLRNIESMGNVITTNPIEIKGK